MLPQGARPSNLRRWSVQWRSTPGESLQLETLPHNQALILQYFYTTRMNNGSPWGIVFMSRCYESQPREILNRSLRCVLQCATVCCMYIVTLHPLLAVRVLSFASARTPSLEQGNILLTPNGKLGLIDYGQVRV